MHLFLPSDTGGTRSITYFHAMAELGIEGLLLLEPAAAFVSLGYFDDPETVDRDFCRNSGLPVMRRPLGGGTVLLGPGQVFYQLVVKRDNAHVRGTVSDIFRRLSEAPIAAYGRLGLDVHYRPINDLVTTDGRKISGQGAGEINGYFCYAGNILCDFDIDVMHRVLRADNERHRAQILSALRDNMSWLSRELEERPDTRTVIDALRVSFASLLAPLHERTLPDSVTTLARHLESELASEETLSIDHPRPRGTIKIREGVYVRHVRGRIANREIEIYIDVAEHRIAAVAIEGIDLSSGIVCALRGTLFTFADVSRTLATAPLPENVSAEDLTRLIAGDI
ncbi:MAG: lipoate--protein ligase family protein [Acidiferrobacteraceae bacterium]